MNIKASFKYILLAGLFLIFSGVVLTNPSSIEAAAPGCSGQTIISWTTYTCGYAPISGYFCIGSPTSFSAVCGGPGNACRGCVNRTNDRCTADSTGCNISTSGLFCGTNGCYIAATPTPTPTPTPPPALCGADGRSNCTYISTNSCGTFPCAACRRRTGYCRSNVDNVTVCYTDCSASNDASCPGCAPAASCTGVTLNDVTVSVGGPVGVVAATVQNVANGTVQWVDFTAVNAPTGGLTGRISISPARDSTLPSYTTNVTGLAPGTARVRGTATVSGAGGSGTCTNTAATRSDVTVTAPGPWWQAVGGAVISGGNIYSTEMPSGEQLVASNANSSTAIALYSGNLGLGGGDTPWKVDAPLAFSGNESLDYAIFEGKIPSDAVTNAASGTMGTGGFSGGSLSPDGYKWFASPGDLTLTNATINGKVVLFVEGNLTITGNVTLASTANDFLLIVVSGDIIVDPTVTSLQGIFFADGGFSTGSGAQPLTTLGSVVTLSGVTLSRNLGGGNANPAETFTFNPANYLLFPQSLSPGKIIWQEVAP